MNEKFVEATHNNSEEVITDACVQILQLLDKLKTKNADALVDGSHVPAVDAGKAGGGRRDSGANQDCSRSGQRGSSKGSVQNSRKIQPAPVVAEHQNSFDKAMRVCMAELVENNHGGNLSSLKIRRMSVDMPTTPKHWWHLLYRHPTDDGMYDNFLSFCDPTFNSPEKRSDYLSFKRSAGSIPMHNFIMAILCIYGGTTFWFATDARLYTHNPMALVAIIFGAFTGLMLMLILFLRLAHFSFTYDIRPLQRFYPATVRFYNSRYSQCIDDGLVIGGTLTASLYMISQQLAPACPPDASMLHTNGCSVHGFLAPEVVLLANTVLITQMLARGVSRFGLVCAWVIMIVSINICLWQAGSSSYLWVYLEVACIQAISYEVERLPLRQFIKSVRMLEAAEVNGQLKVALSKYQVRESEQALEAKRSMVRHIGHEIRTPLNIIGVGTDVLSKELKRLGGVVPDVVLEVVESMKEASGTALEVVNELLMFEKLAAGMTTIATAPTRIVRFVETAMKQHLIPARAKEIDFKLTVEACDRDTGADIDPIKMTIVFRNIFR